MKVSIICLNYRQDLSIARACFQSLKEAQIPFAYEIFLIDNDSKDTVCKTLLKEYKHSLPITFLQNKKNLGYGAGNEVGIQQATGEYILLANLDLTFPKKALQKMITYMDTHVKTGIVGPQLIYPDGTIQDSYRRFPTLFQLILKRTILQKIWKKKMQQYIMTDKDPTQTESVDWLVGACLLLRNNVLQKAGGLARNYFLFFDDTDICRRVWQLGFSVEYLAEIQILHHDQRLSAGGVFDIFRKKVVRIHMKDAWKYWMNWKGIPFDRKDSISYD